MTRGKGMLLAMIGMVLALLATACGAKSGTGPTIGAVSDVVQPTEGFPVEEPPTDGQPTEELPTDGQPTQESPTEEPQKDGKPTQELPEEGILSEGDKQNGGAEEPGRDMLSEEDLKKIAEMLSVYWTNARVSALADPDTAERVCDYEGTYEFEVWKDEQGRYDVWVPRISFFQELSEEERTISERIVQEDGRWFFWSVYLGDGALRRERTGALVGRGSFMPENRDTWVPETFDGKQELLYELLGKELDHMAGTRVNSDPEAEWVKLQICEMTEYDSDYPVYRYQQLMKQGETATEWECYWNVFSRRRGEDDAYTVGERILEPLPEEEVLRRYTQEKVALKAEGRLDLTYVGTWRQLKAYGTPVQYLLERWLTQQEDGRGVFAGELILISSRENRFSEYLVRLRGEEKWERLRFTRTEPQSATASPDDLSEMTMEVSEADGAELPGSRIHIAFEVDITRYAD